MIEGLILDSFAGGGGASTGIEMAFERAFEQGLLFERRYVDIAVNHDPEAIAMHAANHPNTKHLPVNVWSVNWESLVGRQKVGLMWFSPDCKHFSKAKGGKPVKKEIRDLAWVVVKAARMIRPTVIILENVEEFQDWGPLIFKRTGEGKSVAGVTLFQAADGLRPAIPDDVERDKDGNPVLVPDPTRKGQTFREWTAALRRLGYRMEWKELRACDYGAPTIRKRFFMIARCDDRAIVWPRPTHGDPRSEAVLKGELKPWRTAAEIIDWSIPCPSIFLTKEEGRALKVKRPLETATMDRIAKGVDRYVLKAKKPFIVNLTHQGGDRSEAVDAPFNTVTGAHRGEKAVVVPSIVGVGSRAGQSPPRGGDMPFGTVTTSKGGMHGLVAATMVQTGYGERAGQDPRALDVEKPLGTVVAGGVKHAAVECELAPFTSYAQQGGNNRPADEPLHTVCASTKDQNQVVAPVLVRTAHGERDSKGKKRGRGEHAADQPLPTVTASPEFGIVGASIVRTDQTSAKHAGVAGTQDPLRTQATGPSFALVAPKVAAFMAQHNIDGRTGEGNTGRPADAPLSTVTTSGSHQNVVSAAMDRIPTFEEWLASTKDLGGTREEYDRIYADPAHWRDGLVTGHMIDMHGANMRHAGLDEPLRTLTAQGYHAAQVAAFLAKYYGADQDPRLDEPLHTATTKARHSLVTVEIEGEPYVIVDIGMRMLKPRELFRAQGFPDSYIIEWVPVDLDNGLRWDGGEGARGPLPMGPFLFRKLTATAQIKMCGNSVCPQMADALVWENVVMDTPLYVRPANDPDRLGFGLFGEVPIFSEEAAA